jgi:hypothetical protein
MNPQVSEGVGLAYGGHERPSPMVPPESPMNSSASRRAEPPDSDNRASCTGSRAVAQGAPASIPPAAVMNPNENDFVCPVCGRPMRLLTVLRQAPGEQTFVVQCRPCGLSTTKTVDAPRQSDSAR